MTRSRKSKLSGTRITPKKTCHQSKATRRFAKYESSKSVSVNSVLIQGCETKNTVDMEKVSLQTFSHEPLRRICTNSSKLCNTFLSKKLLSRKIFCAVGSSKSFSSHFCAPRINIFAPINRAPRSCRPRDVRWAVGHVVKQKTGSNFPVVTTADNTATTRSRP